MPESANARSHDAVQADLFSQASDGYTHKGGEETLSLDTLTDAKVLKLIDDWWPSDDDRASPSPCDYFILYFTFLKCLR